MSSRRSQMAVLMGLMWLRLHSADSLTACFVLVNLLEMLDALVATTADADSDITTNQP